MQLDILKDLTLVVPDLIAILIKRCNANNLIFPSPSFQLLYHRDPSVQKVAFECILTYNYKYLNPYR